MAEGGLDLRTWLTLLGVLTVFFGIPAITVAVDVRKKRRALQATERAGAEGPVVAAGALDGDGRSPISG